MAAACWAEPQPGDIFREFTYTVRFSELDPSSTRPGIENMRRAMQDARHLSLPGLQGVRRAEVSVEYWGGHSGTADQKFRLNRHEWIQIPQPEGTPGKPQCYYRTVLGRATVDVPLAQFVAGLNEFRFTAGPQICHSFNWGFYWVYAFTVRFYYDSETPHPSGRIVAPAVIGDHPALLAEVKESDATISAVDFIGEYEDFNWEGDGRFRQWHYITEKGRLARHIATVTRAPYRAIWDTTWIPDQKEPVKLVARITDSSGMIYMTPAVNVNMRREARSVRMYTAADVPEKFGVRVGNRMECKLPVTGQPGKPRAARLVFSTWSAAHGDETGFNGTKLADRTGYVHNYSFDTLPVPAALVKEGENTFYIFSKTQHHALEVNWPGPVLLVEYGPPALKPLSGAGWWNNSYPQRIGVEVQAGRWDRADRTAEVTLPAAVKPEAARLVEIGPEGIAVDDEVPFQIDAGRSLIVLLKGRTPAGTARRYHLYSGGPPSKPAPQGIRVTDDVDCEGQKSFRIETAAGSWSYHKEGAGFASFKDPDGAEWIGYHPGGRSAGEFRGIPNLGNFGHPGYSGERGADSRLASQGPLKVTIESERHDKQYACRWEIYARHARLTMLRNPEPYWVLYEGTPGGRLNEKEGFQVWSDGTRKTLEERWSGDLPDPEWIYFGDPGSKRVLYLANHSPDLLPDQYWPMDGNMTVFGFAREYRCCGHFFQSSPARFTVGIAESKEYPDVRTVVESAMAEPDGLAGPVEKNN